MGRLVGRRIGAAVVLIGVAFAVGWLGVVMSHKGLDRLAKLSEIASFVLVAAGLLVAPFGKIGQWLRGPQPITSEELAKALTRLQATLNAAWVEEGSGIYEYLPMEVRFAAWPEAGGQTTGGAGEWEADGLGYLAGDFDDVAEVFARKPRYRRIVLGEAGAGKTVLVKELQRSLLETPGSVSPLPVIVPAAAWKPDRQSLLDWLAQQLAEDHAWLAVTHARALIAGGKVLPILDGLDEMPVELQPVAIARLNEHRVYRPLVVTSRPEEYWKAVGVNGAGVTRAEVVGVLPLLDTDIRAYLDPGGSGLWHELLSDMQADAIGELGSVLANPLMLWLARVDYDGENPGELALFGSGRSIENHLLDKLVPAVYRADTSPLAHMRFHSDEKKAKHWLSQLADEDYREPSAMKWWRFGTGAGKWRLLGIGLRGGVLWSLAAWLLVWVLARHGNWRHGGFAGPVNFGELLLGGPVGRLIRPTVHVLAAAAPKSYGGDAQAGVATFFRLAGDLVSHPFYMAITAVAFILGTALRLGMSLPSEPRRLRIGAGRVVAQAVRSCLFLFIAPIGLLLPLLYSPHRPITAAGFFEARSTWITLLAVSLSGLTSIPSSFARRSDTSGSLSPQESLRLDRQADLVVTATRRSALAAAMWLISGPQIAAAYAVFAVSATLVAISLGGQGGFASRSYIDARFWLAAEGRAPWRIMSFLADASRRGVLRQVGAAYQFRHNRLEEQARQWRLSRDGSRLKEWLGRLREFAALIHPPREWRWETETLNQFTEQAARIRAMAQAGPGSLPAGFAQTLEKLADRSWLWTGEHAAAHEILDACRTLAETDPVTYRPVLAKVLNASARQLPRREALRAVEEAVGIYQELAEADPAANLPRFAGAARDLADQLIWLGRQEQGLRLITDMTDTCRRLAETDPTALRPILAQSLGDLSNRTWKSRPDDSLAALREAAIVYRELTDSDPVKFGPDLRESLDMLATRLNALGRPEDELSAVRDAVDAYREWAELIGKIRRQITTADLAPLLQPRQAEAGPRRSGRARAEERKAALEAARTAAATLAELAEGRPDEFLLDLADALRGLAADVRAAGRHREAQVIADEADRLRRRRGSSGSRYWAYWITRPRDRMEGQALRLWKLGERQEAVAAAHASQALGTTRWADTAEGQEHRWPAWVMARRREEAQVRSERKDVQLWRRMVRSDRAEWFRLSRKDPDAISRLARHQEFLAGALERESDALDTLAFHRQVAGRAAEAAAAAQDALIAQRNAADIYRYLVSKQRHGPWSGLATSLDTLGLRLRTAGQLDAAEAAALEAHEVRLRWQEAPSSQP
jgi:hypothetical protein